MPELVAADVDGYVRAAVGLAGDGARLAGLHRTLRDRVLASPLMDGPGYAARVGEVYRGMWRAWCAGGA
jgi:predicted O-linked N-acetylglucosamine transferase (SPINDLY family)